MVHVFLTSTQTSHLKVFYFLFLQYGRAALEAVMKSVLGFDAPLVPIPKTYDGDFFEGSYLKIENLFFTPWHLAGYCVSLVIELLLVLH